MANILVVDDDLRIREFLTALLQKKFQVETATEAEHAVAMIKKKPYDAVIVDIHMPGISGLELLKNIRGARNSVPIVIYTGELDASVEKEARMAGANEVLSKTLSNHIIIERIEKIIGSREKIFDPASAKAGKKYLLIVDDEPRVRKLLSDFFKSKNFEVVEAGGGEEALKIAKEQKPSVVLLDVRMPGMDGLETLSRLKQLYPDLGVVMTTGEEADETVKSAMQRGAYGYVLKPFDFMYLELVVMSKLIIAEA